MYLAALLASDHAALANFHSLANTATLNWFFFYSMNIFTSIPAWRPIPYDMIYVLELIFHSICCKELIFIKSIYVNAVTNDDHHKEVLSTNLAWYFSIYDEGYMTSQQSVKHSKNIYLVKISLYIDQDRFLRE